ncbi:MAG: ATP-binding protein [Verrucomicrobia bacterium]|nr:ATP-binding protein [Verrucomicrobiota bacterium]
MNKPASGFVKFVRHRVFDVNRIEERSVQSKFLATAAAIALAIFLGAMDYVTGRDWAISAFYLLPICIAAWGAGRWTGYAVSVLCTSEWFLSDLLNGATYQSPLIPVWNGIMLLVFFLVIVWLLTAFQNSHYHLEKTVEQRTAALRAEMEERKRLEQAKLQAERLGVVGSMAAQVAHEIRNPLGSISLNLDLIGEEVDALAKSNSRSSDECRMLLHEMRAQVLRIGQVLQEYLQFARMPRSERAALSLRDLLEEKLGFVQPLLNQKQVGLRKIFDPDLPPVHADREQLWEALLNLIRNAVDAMPGGGNLTITTKKNGTRAVVSIGDNGLGMTEDEARNLFVPFFTTKTDGTGLGLAHTQQIVNEHGGRIDWTTKRGEGSTFTIQLPLEVGA